MFGSLKTFFFIPTKCPEHAELLAGPRGYVQTRGAGREPHGGQQVGPRRVYRVVGKGAPPGAGVGVQGRRSEPRECSGVRAELEAGR